MYLFCAVCFTLNSLVCTPSLTLESSSIAISCVVFSLVSFPGSSPGLLNAVCQRAGKESGNEAISRLFCNVRCVRKLIMKEILLRLEVETPLMCDSGKRQKKLEHCETVLSVVYIKIP